MKLEVKIYIFSIRIATTFTKCGSQNECKWFEYLAGRRVTYHMRALHPAQN